MRRSFLRIHRAGDWEYGNTEKVDGFRERLKQLGILQFFFPAADHLALGLVDRGVSEQTAIINSVESAPILGHPFGQTEIVQQQISIPDLVDALHERGFLVEGEHGTEITPQGVTTRTNVKFRPREGVISKIMPKINVNFNLKT